MAKRNAVVVTHTRLRQTGTVVAEAVSQLRVAGFEVAIIDNRIDRRMPWPSATRWW